MPRGPRLPLKQGRNGSRSINAQIKALNDKIDGIDTSEPFEPGAAVADAVDDSDIVTQFNALLASLRAAGLIEPSAP